MSGTQAIGGRPDGATPAPGATPLPGGLPAIEVGDPSPATGSVTVPAPAPSSPVPAPPQPGSGTGLQPVQRSARLTAARREERHHPRSHTAWLVLAGVAAGGVGFALADLQTGVLCAAAAVSGAWALLGARAQDGLPAALEKHMAVLRDELTRLGDEQELQRGVFEVSAELVGCVEERDAQARFSSALRRYWDCESADLLVWERGAWRSLGGGGPGRLPLLDQPVTVPGAGGAGDDLVLDISPGTGRRAAIILRNARPQPSLAGRLPDEQRAVAETLRGQLALSLRRVLLYGELQALARIDPLTGTHRRWYGEQRLKELVDGGDVVTVAMVDIDHFKRVNDGYGHAAGDQVLGAVGRTLVAGLRSNDLVCRWGGEEFLLILPDTPPDGAMLVSDRLRAAVAALTGLAVATTVSIGVASCAHDDTHFEIVARADEALYLAKRGGRNRVVEAASLGDSESRQLRTQSRKSRTQTFMRKPGVPSAPR